jgi:hypothetical protein
MEDKTQRERERESQEKKIMEPRSAMVWPAWGRPGLGRGDGDS